ncbi:MAG: M20/M25/M40 family metallo-hydrolase [Aggregatilineales bacterium]
MRATIRGAGGHGSTYVANNTMMHLGKFLHRLNRRFLPVHITPPARQFIEGIASTQSASLRLVLSALLNLRLTDHVLRTAQRVQPQIRDLIPLLHNTVNATIIHAGTEHNVIPSMATVDMDGRLLPGYTPDQLTTELQQVIQMRGVAEYEVTKWEAFPETQPDMSFFGMLSDILKQADPGSTPVPFLLNASTDGRHFARLGIQTYGFTPMKLPIDFNFIKTIHAANERIPVDALDFGTNCLYEVLQRYGR